MQEKERNISPVKERIKQYVDTLSISMNEFYAKTGMSRGTLSNSSGLTVDLLIKFFAVYPKVNPEWIVMGTGLMLKKEEMDHELGEDERRDVVEEPKGSYQSRKTDVCRNCDRLEKMVDAQEKLISHLSHELEELRGRIGGHDKAS